MFSNSQAKNLPVKSDEIFYRRFFLPTKFYGDFFSSDKVFWTRNFFNLYVYYLNPGIIASALAFNLSTCACSVLIREFQLINRRFELGKP